MHVAITGASSGIGKELALAYGKLASHLTLVARRVEILEELARRISCPVSSFKVDLSEVDRAHLWVDRVQKEVGPIDIFINNAGVHFVGHPFGVSEEEVQFLFNVDFHTPLKLMHYLAREMRQRGGGTIVNITSIAGLVATPGMYYYNVAKSAFSVASEALATELRGTGVHILTVYPGPVSTPMEAAIRRRYADFASSLLPTGRPEVLARRVIGAVRRRKRRLFYPRIYRLTYTFRNVVQWVLDHFTPYPKEEEER